MLEKHTVTDLSLVPCQVYLTPPTLQILSGGKEKLQRKFVQETV